MKVAEARQVDDPLVHPRVVLHRAGTERIEARVEPEVAVGDAWEVAGERRFRDVCQPWRPAARELFGDVRDRQPIAGQPAGATTRLGLLEDQLHPATSVSTSANLSMSAGLRFSVTATSRASSSPA